MNKSFGFALGLVCLLQAPDCGAQEQQSFKTLVGRGFEIKSVTFARGESTDNRDSFLVTLQRTSRSRSAFSRPRTGST